MRVCADCPADISHSHGNAYLCGNCRRARKKRRQQLYGRGNLMRLRFMQRKWRMTFKIKSALAS